MSLIFLSTKKQKIENLISACTESTYNKSLKNIHLVPQFFYDKNEQLFNNFDHLINIQYFDLEILSRNAVILSKQKTLIGG